MHSLLLIRRCGAPASDTAIPDSRRLLCIGHPHRCLFMLSIARTALICGQVLNVYHTDSRATQGEAAAGPAGELHKTWRESHPAPREPLSTTQNRQLDDA